MWETVLQPGELLIFAPPIVHEGTSVGEVCQASVTFQFTHPAPAAFWRAFWPRVRHTMDMKSCHATIKRLARPGGKGADFDADGDGVLSPAELGLDVHRFHADRDHVTVAQYDANVRAFARASAEPRAVPVGREL